MFESFAHDIRDKSLPRFFMTRDHDKVGDVRRWTPDSVDWDDPWNILLGNGTLEFLVVEPSTGKNNSGSYYWTTEWDLAAENCKVYFPNSEGIDVVGDTLYFVTKKAKSMFVLNLDDNTYHNISTKGGLFDGQPDQLIRLFDHANTKNESDSILYMTEDGGKYAGVHGRNAKGDYVTILESHEYADETTGLAFSPDSKHLYVAYQDNGLLFDVTRTDGLPFNGMMLAVKFHQVEAA
jgi:sugar lactone lactonase YvrE